MKQFLRYLVLAAGLWPAVATAQVVGLSVPDTTVSIGSDLWLPVRVDSSLTGLNVTSVQLQFAIDHNVVDPDSVLLTGSRLEGLGWTVTVHRPSADVVRIAAAGTTPISGNGAILMIRVKLLTTGWSNFQFTGTLTNMLNEGTPSVTLRNGWVQVVQPPSVDVWPDDGIVAVGEHLQFSTGGGTEPYTWSTSDPGVATIDATGLLTAVGRGAVIISVEDAAGRRGRTDRLVTVRAIGISAPDTSIATSRMVEVPVRVTSLTPWNVTAGSVRIDYNAAAVTPVEIVTAGTILEGIVPAVNLATAGTIRFSFATDHPIQGQGTLFIVRFQTSAAPGWSNIDFAECLFNEDLPARVDNGTISITSLATISIGASGDILLAEDTLAFSVWGGEAPYSWTSSDSLIARVDSDGSLIGVRSGRVRVTVHDAQGALGVSNEIQVFDGAVKVDDRFGASPGWVDVPIRVARMASGRQVSSYQLRLSYDPNILAFESVTTTGTATASWSMTHNASGSIVNVAGASSGSLTGIGALCVVRFAVLPSIPLRSDAYLNLEQVLLNEGFPMVDRWNGRVRIAEPPGTVSLWSPGNGWTQQPLDQELTWGAVEFAEQYELQIATDPAFAAPVFWDSTLTAQALTPGNLANGTAYFWRVRARSILGIGAWSEVWQFTTATTVGVIGADATVPDRFVLEPNYPNPFNPSTRLTFHLKEPTPVTLTIYTLTGAVVEHLIDAALPAGTYETWWNASQMPSGIYLCRMVAGRFSMVQRLVLLK